LAPNSTWSRFCTSLIKDEKMSDKTNNRIFLVLLWTGAVTAWAQPSPKTIYSFPQIANGAVPNNGVMIGNGGVIYGTTLAGGKYDAGVVYSLTPPASPGGSWTEEVLTNFESGGGAMESPAGVLVAGANGVIYGATTGGRTDYKSFSGEVYSLRPPSASSHPWKRTALCTFAPRLGPVAIVKGGKGVLYGVTEVNALVFSCAPPASSGGGWSETTLYNLPDGGGSNFYTNLILGHGGVIYSTSDGTVSTGGSVFTLTPPAAAGDTWTADPLFGFPAIADGVDPDGLVMGPGGVLYGSTVLGGDTIDANCNPSGCGVVFALTPPASPAGA
jgi:uncharacterized repeat protein (TIGR03803 family)